MAEETGHNTVTTGDFDTASRLLQDLEKESIATRLNQQFFCTSQSVGDFDNNLSFVVEKGDFFQLRRQVSSDACGILTAPRAAKERITSQVLKTLDERMKKRRGRGRGRGRINNFRTFSQLKSDHSRLNDTHRYIANIHLGIPNTPWQPKNIQIRVPNSF
jgi:hypothetical protein